MGCGWSIEQIYEHLRQFSDGIGDKYIGEGRLRGEVDRSAGKYTKRELPLFDGWTAPGVRTAKPPPPATDRPSRIADPELEDDDPRIDEDEPPEPEPNA